MVNANEAPPRPNLKGNCWLQNILALGFAVSTLVALVVTPEAATYLPNVVKMLQGANIHPELFPVLATGCAWGLLGANHSS